MTAQVDLYDISNQLYELYDLIESIFFFYNPNCSIQMTADGHVITLEDKKEPENAKSEEQLDGDSKDQSGDKKKSDG